MKIRKSELKKLIKEVIDEAGVKGMKWGKRKQTIPATNQKEGESFDSGKKMSGSKFSRYYPPATAKRLFGAKAAGILSSAKEIINFDSEEDYSGYKAAMQKLSSMRAVDKYNDGIENVANVYDNGDSWVIDTDQHGYGNIFVVKK